MQRNLLIICTVCSYHTDIIASPYRLTTRLTFKANQSGILLKIVVDNDNISACAWVKRSVTDVTVANASCTENIIVNTTASFALKRASVLIPTF